MTDNIAKDELFWSIAEQRYIVSKWPSEGVSFYKDGVKVTSSLTCQLASLWGQGVAKDVCIANGITDA